MSKNNHHPILPLVFVQNTMSTLRSTGPVEGFVCFARMKRECLKANFLIDTCSVSGSIYYGAFSLIKNSFYKIYEPEPAGFCESPGIVQIFLHLRFSNNISHVIAEISKHDEADDDENK